MKRIHILSATAQISLFILFLSICPVLWAAQDAIVISEKAVIYADKTMTSPIGYVARGKRITVGEVARNKAQLYPIIVSGKVAYIRVIDVSTEMVSLDSNTLVAERFARTVQKDIENYYALSYFTNPSSVTIEKDSLGELSSGDAFVWNGIQLRGDVRTSAFWDIGVVADYAEGQKGNETFRMFEFGGEGSYRIYTGKNFIFRWQNQAQFVPFASYSLGTANRVNGYGFSVGSGVNANWIFGDHFGAEIFGGFYYTKLFGFDLPNPNNPKQDITINPAFAGTRLGAGVTYQF